MRKDQYHLVIIYCNIQDKGYKRCEFPSKDCRKCSIAIEYEEVSN